MPLRHWEASLSMPEEVDQCFIVGDDIPGHISQMLQVDAYPK